MNLIYILKPDGQSEPLPEIEVRTLLAKGRLQPEDYFWKEGMTDWLPLKELASVASESSIAPPRRSGDVSPITFAPGSSAASSVAPPKREAGPETSWPYSSMAKLGPKQAIVPNPPPAAPATKLVPMYFAREDVEPLTTWLIFLLVVCFITGLGALYFELKIYRMVTRSYIIDDLDRLRALLKLASTVELAAFFVAAIPFLTWVHHTSENARGFAQGTRFTSRWAVFYLFAPVYNLFRPWQFLQDNWKVSTKPPSWYVQENSIVVGLWVALWDGFVLLLPVAVWLAYFGDSGLGPLYSVEIRIVHQLIYLALCPVSALMIFLISAKQKRIILPQ